MPPARSASARATAARTSAARAAATAERRRERTQRSRRPQRVTLRSPHLRVRWERVGRVGLLLVLAVVIGLYADHAISYLTARAASNRQHAIVAHLERQNAYFEQRQRSRSALSTLLALGRKLGMVPPAQQPSAIPAQPAR